MSDLLRRQFGSRLRSHDSNLSNHHTSTSFHPYKWSKYFNIRDDIEIESGTFRIYRRGVEGPLLFFIHGGGFSALSWAVLSAAMTREVRCQCLAVDMRGHGDTHCHDESDLSIETLTSDIIKIIFAMFPTEAPPIVLIGHSMGGAVAVHVAQKRAIPSLAALVVIDVVEGTALESLYGMTAFLRSRPQGFHSLAHGIEWCVRTGQVRNPESARVSFPGQLRRMCTGETATCELDRGVAFIDVNTHGPHKSGSTDDQRGLSAVPEASDMETTSEHSFSTADVKEDVSSHDVHPNATETIADSIPHDLSEASPHTQVHRPKSTADSVHLSETSRTSVPSGQRRVEYTWRVDLSKTEQYWRGWFENLSSIFLSIPEPKLLIVAGVDRLDKELTIGQMQGKFQLQILPKSGHAVHEDTVEEVATCLANFLIRNQFTEARANFDK